MLAGVSLSFPRSSLLSSAPRGPLHSRHCSGPAAVFGCVVDSSWCRIQSNRVQRVRVLIVLQLARADSVCPSSSLSMIRSCGVGLVPINVGVHVKSMYFVKNVKILGYTTVSMNVPHTTFRSVHHTNCGLCHASRNSVCHEREHWDVCRNKCEPHC